jgi:HEAT repeat protein
MAKKTVEQLKKQLQSKDVEERQEAAWALKELEDEAEKASKELEEALNDEDWAVRKLSLLALGKIYKSNFEDTAINFLKNDPHGEVKAGAIDTLAEFGSENAVPALLDATKDEYKIVREMASWALGKLGSKSKNVAPQLIALFENADPIEQKIISWTLAEIGSKEAIEPLRKAADKTDIPELKADLAFSLAKLEDKEYIGISILQEMADNGELTKWEIEELEELLKEKGL